MSDAEKIRCSLRSHELLFVTSRGQAEKQERDRNGEKEDQPGKGDESEEDKSTFLSRMAMVAQNSLKDVASDIKKRCSGVCSFWGRCPDDGNSAPCLIDAKAREEELEEKRCSFQNDLKDAEHLRELQESCLLHRKELLSISYNYKDPKSPDCSKEMAEAERIIYSMGFGNKMDFIYQVPCNHTMWSTEFRRQIVAHDKRGEISTIFSIPSYRIKTEPRKTKGEEEVAADQEGKSNIREGLVTFTFLTFPPNLRGSPVEGEGSRAEHLRNLIGSLKTIQEKYSFQIYLTMCTMFPMVLRTNFSNFDDLNLFLDEICRPKQQLATGSCTVISLYDQRYYQDDFPPKERRFVLKKGEEEKKARFRILLKTRIDGEDLTIDDIVRGVIKILNGEDPTRRPPLPEGEDWPIRVKGQSHERPDEESSLLAFHNQPYFWDAVVEVETAAVGLLLEVVAEKVRPLQNIVRTTTFPILPPRSTDGAEKIMHDKPAGGKFEPLVSLGEGYHKSFTSSPELSPFQREGVLSSQASQHPFQDPLNSRLYDLKVQYNSLTAYLEHLQRCWYSQIADYSPQPNQSLPHTFPLLIYYLLEENKKLQARSEELKKNTITSDELREIWEDVEDSKELLEELLGETNNIVHTLNKRYMGWQAVTISEPVAWLGGQEGAMELSIDIAARLFRHYCSKPKRPNIEPWKSFKKAPWSTFSVQEGEDRFQWKGIVSIFGGNDFALEPEYSLLHLHIYYTLQTQAYLLPLAHEASHQILYMFYLAKATEFYKFWEDIYEAAFELATDKWGPKNIPRIIYQRLYPIWKKIKRDQENRREARYDDKEYLEELFKDEFLTDIMSGFCTGPAFFRSLRELAFSNLKRVDPPHPPPWLRFKLGSLMAERLGWVDEDAGIDDIWDIAYVDEEIEKYVFDSEPDEKIEAEMFEEPFYYLYLALERDPSLLENLEHWLGDQSVDFLFYPLPKNEKDKEARQKVIFWVNSYCQELAERIIFDDEVVLDAPLKYLATISELANPREVRRPTHPSGRLLLSLHYSEGDWKTFLQRLHDDSGVDLLNEIDP